MSASTKRSTYFFSSLLDVLPCIGKDFVRATGGSVLLSIQLTNRNGGGRILTV